MIDAAFDYLASKVFGTGAVENGWMLVGKVKEGSGRPHMRVVVSNGSGESTAGVIVGVDIHSLDSDGNANIMVKLDNPIPVTVPIRVVNLETAAH